MQKGVGERKVDGDKIRRLCQEKGIRLSELATMAGIPRGTLRRKVNGNPNAKVKTIQKIAKALGVKEEELYKQHLEIKLQDGEDIESLVKRICEDKIMTQVELAELVGVTRVTIHQIINGIGSIRNDTRYCIAKGLGIEIETIEGLSKKARKMRIEANMTQAELATKAGVSTSSIYKFENNPQACTQKTIERIMSALKAES